MKESEGKYGKCKDFRFSYGGLSFMRFRFEFDEINGKNDIKERVVKKFSALDKYLKNVREDFKNAAVRIVKGERYGYKVKIDMSLPGKEVVAEGKAKSLLDAIDVAYNKSARVVRSYFEKLKSKKKR